MATPAWGNRATPIHLLVIGSARASLPPNRAPSTLPSDRKPIESMPPSAVKKTSFDSRLGLNIKLAIVRLVLPAMQSHPRGSPMTWPNTGVSSASERSAFFDRTSIARDTMNVGLPGFGQIGDQWIISQSYLSIMRL
jgi:hypothetical protein